MSVILKNKKVHLNYEILEEFEAGIELRGFEVKSLRSGRGSLDGVYVKIRGGEACLVGMQISPYQEANTPQEYDPSRSRRLLLRAKEIKKLADADKQNGLTMVPVSMYGKGSLIKVKVAVVRGKKKYDKREDLKKKTAKRDIDRTLKRA